MRSFTTGARRLLPLAAGLIALATAVASCGSSSVTAPPSSAALPGTSASAGAPGGSQGDAHTAAIKACGLLDEATVTTLVGFPAKEFGSGDPVARVPIADRATTLASGAAIRISFCGYWESGVKAELSRDVSIEITQGDPAKPGSWSTDAAHAQFMLLQDNAAAQQPQVVAGLGNEAFSAAATGAVTLTVRSGDLVLRVEGDAPPGSTVLTVDALKGVAQAVLARV